MSKKFPENIRRWLLLLLCCLLDPSKGQQTQYLMLWMGNTCMEAPLVFATGSSSHPLPSGTVLSYRTNGLWAIELCISGTNVCSQRTVQTGDGVGCRSIPISTTNNLALVTMFGNSLQNERRLHLFSEFQFQGNEQIVGNDTSFTTIFSARSFFFAGVNSWEYGQDSNSNTACLSFLPSVGNAGYGFTFLLTSNLRVGRVKYGCGGISFPPTTTTNLLTTPGADTPTTSTPKPDSGHRNAHSLSLLVIVSLCFRFI